MRGVNPNPFACASVPCGRGSTMAKGHAACGIAERSGASLKALVGALCQTHAVATFSEMQEAAGEAIAAYNADPHEAGVSPMQLVTGRNPQVCGDVFNDFGKRLAEHSLLEAEPSIDKWPFVKGPEWRWFVASEGANGIGFAANCFISFRGQLTKCPMEHVRKASSLGIASGSWEAGIDDVLRAAQRDAAHPTSDVVQDPAEDEKVDEHAAVPQPMPFTPELLAAMKPEESAVAPGSRRESLGLEDVASQSGVEKTPAPASVPVESGRGIFQSSTLQSSWSRARSLDVERGVKRPASVEPPAPARRPAEMLEPSTSSGPSDSIQLEGRPAFDALTLGNSCAMLLKRVQEPTHCWCCKLKLKWIAVLPLTMSSTATEAGMEDGPTHVSVNGMSLA